MNDIKHRIPPSGAVALPNRKQAVSRPVYIAGSGQTSSDQDTVSGAWHAIQRGKYLVLGCIAGGLLVAVLVSGLQTPMYQAETILEVRDPSRPVSPFVQVQAGSDAAVDSAIQTEVTLLHSDPLIRSVIERLNLANTLGATSKSDTTRTLWKTLRNQTLPPESSEDRAIQVAKKNLSISHQARIIDVDYHSSDPKVAADFVNTLAQEHLSQNSASDVQAAKRMRAWLDNQTADINAKLAKAEGEMQGYASGAGLVQTSSNDTVAQEQLRLLSEELAHAEADRMVAQSKNTVATAATPDAMPQVMNDTVLRDYESKLTDLRQKSADLQSIYQPDYYKVQEVENQIKELQGAIQKEVGAVKSRSANDLKAAQERENMLQSKFDSESQHVTTQESKFIHYGTLQQELEAMRAMHAELLEKAQQLAISSAAPNNELQIVSTAIPPDRPYTPNYPLNLSLGLFVGLFGGVVAAVAREHVRPRLRAPGDTSLLLQLPELASIPSIDPRRGAQFLLPAPAGDRMENRLELAAWNGTPALLIESIHEALASITASCERGSRIILFTSPAPGDGKTTIVANLAISLALCRRRVLLIDGDLRRPRLHKVFNVGMEPGLADALREVAPTENPAVEKVHTLSIPNLFLMTSGKLAATHAPLFGGKHLQQVLDRMRSQYDVILIDAPPVLHGPDARLLGRYADSAILITRARKTSHQDAVAAASRLAADRIPLAGTILNDWNPRSDSAAYTSYLPVEPEPEAALRS